MVNPEFLALLKLIPRLSTIEINQKVSGETIIKPEKKNSFDLLVKFIGLINVSMFDPSLPLEQRKDSLHQLFETSKELFANNPEIFPRDKVGTLLISNDIPNAGKITFKKEQENMSAGELSKLPTWTGVDFSNHIMNVVLPSWKVA